MGALIENTIEIIAGCSFVQVHVEIAVLGGFFTKQECIAWINDGSLLHAIADIQSGGICGGIGEEIIPTIDEITTRRSVSHIGHRGTRGEKSQRRVGGFTRA